MIHDPSLCKLGRGPVVRPAGMKMLASLIGALPPAPKNPAWYLGGKSYDNRTLAPVSTWDMDGNDTYGDCVFAGSAHAVQTWSNAAGKLFVPSQAQVLGAYADYTGFNAADPNTDNGAVEGDTWTRWEASGMFGGDRLLGFIGLNPKSVAQVGDAIAYFGGSMLGVELPIAAQDQDIWDVPKGGPVGDGAPGSWGGHCVWLINRDDAGVTLVTWGALKRASWAWMATYCSEAYALLSPRWIDAKGNTPGGVPLASMMLDLKRVAVS